MNTTPETPATALPQEGEATALPLETPDRTLKARKRWEGKWRRTRQWRGVARDKVRLFRASPLVPDSLKRRILPLLARRVVSFEANAGERPVPALWLLLVAFAVGVLATPSIARSLLGIHSASSSSLPVLPADSLEGIVVSYGVLTLLPMVLMAALVACPYLSGLLGRPKPGRVRKSFAAVIARNHVGFALWAFSWVGICVIAVAVISLLYRGGAPSTPVAVLLNAPLGTLAWMTTMASLVSLCLMFSDLRRRLFVALHPDTFVANRLLELIALLEERPERWQKVAFRSLLPERIEEIAACVEHRIPELVRTRNPHTDGVQRQVMREIANAIRSLQTWVLTPKEDTREWLVLRLAEALACVVTAEWDGLERREEELARVPVSWKAALVDWLKAIASAVIPIALFLVFRTPLHLTEPFAQYIKICLLLWTALVLVARVDPLFGVKVTALKNTLSLFKLSSAKKE
jgi:hypothetical protein